MLQALLPEINTINGQLAFGFAAYVTLVVTLMWIVAEGSIRQAPAFVAPTRSPGRVPGLLTGALVGLAMVQILPMVFPDAEVSAQLRSSPLSVRNW